MDLIIELILQLAFVGADESIKCRKIPKAIRYILLLIIALDFLAVIGLLVFAGVLLFNENALFSGLMMALSIAMTIFIVNKIKKAIVLFKNENAADARTMDRIRS